MQSDLPQSNLLLGTRVDVQLPTHMSFSKKLQQPLSKRLKHLIRLGCVVLQAGSQAMSVHVLHVCMGREKSEITCKLFPIEPDYMLSLGYTHIHSAGHC